MIGKLDALGTRGKMGLLLALVVILGLLVSRFVVKPCVAEYEAAQSAIAEAQGDLNENLRVAAAGPSITGAFEESRRHMDEVTTSAQDVGLLKGAVDALAGAHAVTLVSMKHLEPAPDKPGRFVREYRVEIGEFECPVSSLLAFLDAVHQAPGLLRVARLSVEPQGDGDASLLKGAMVITKVVTIPDRSLGEG